MIILYDNVASGLLCASYLEQDYGLCAQRQSSHWLFSHLMLSGNGLFTFCLFQIYPRSLGAGAAPRYEYTLRELSSSSGDLKEMSMVKVIQLSLIPRVQYVSIVPGYGEANIIRLDKTAALVCL